MSRLADVALRIRAETSFGMIAAGLAIVPRRSVLASAFRSALHVAKQNIRLAQRTQEAELRLRAVCASKEDAASISGSVPPFNGSPLRAEALENAARLLAMGKPAIWVRENWDLPYETVRMAERLDRKR